MLKFHTEILSTTPHLISCHEHIQNTFNLSQHWSH